MRPGGPVLPELLGWLLNAALVVLAVAVVWVVCRRGRSERRLDKHLDEHLVRRLPVCSIVLLVLAMVYAGWSRPGWRSAGRLPGDMTFGGITLVQGLLVIALGVVAHTLYRSRPDPRTAMYGLGKPRRRHARLRPRRSDVHAASPSASPTGWAAPTTPCLDHPSSSPGRPPSSRPSSW